MPANSLPRVLAFAGAGAAMVIGLYLSSLYSYLLFHGLVEIVTISIAFTLFILTWNTHRYLTNDYLRLLGVGYAFIAAIDLLHTFAYKGMGVFPDYDANLPTQLWIAARYLQALTLFAAPFFVERKASIWAMFGGFAAAVLALVGMVYSGNFPDCFIEGRGLTAFKIGSEYAIGVVLLASLFLLYRKRKHFDDKVFMLAAVSVACTALSEISFTSYASVYGFANLVGHFSKLAAFYLIYRAILVTGLKEPFDLIFKDLKRTEQALQRARDGLEEKVKERTAELRASEEKLRSQYALIVALINSSKDIIIFSLDGEYRYTVFNEIHRQEMKKVWDVDISIGMNLLDCMRVPELRAAAKLSMDRALRGEAFSEIQHQPEPDIYYEFSWNPILQDNEAVGLTAFIRDITERKHAEARILKLNRIYATLSNINQAIVRIHDAGHLMLEACRTAVENGGFGMAWIGMTNTRTGKVDVVASYGTTGDYLEKLNIDLKDESRGNGPTGTAVKTGKHYISNDIGNDDRMIPWRENALKYGYKSSAVFPLIVAGKAVGAFNIYSSQSEFFNDDDIKLLDEMAMDISFALEFMESAAERRRAEDALHKLNEELELRVKERTAELELKNRDLEKLNKLFIGRELRMKELKEKIAKLEEKSAKGSGK